MNSRLNVQRRSLFYELPYFGRNIILDHGQFNNCLSSHLPSKKYLESLCSIHDLYLFSLNMGEAQNPDFNLNNHCIQRSYFSPHSFNVLKSKFRRYGGSASFSLLHNNHSCPIHPICNGSPKWWRSVTDRDGSTGSDDSSRIVTDCFDSHTGSHVAKRDSGSELEVVYTYPRKSWRIVTIRDESLSWRGPATIRDGS